MSYTVEVDALCIRLRSGDLDRQHFVEECARLACHAVGCSRCGLWVFAETASGRVLQCLGMYDRASNCMVQVEDRLQEDSDTYFAALQEHGHVIAVDAESNPATRRFFDAGLRPHGVRSLMSAAFALNGRLFGAFTCSQVGERANWSKQQLAILIRIGSRATLALASVSPNQLRTLFGDL